MATAKKSFVAPRVTARNWTLQYNLIQVPIGLTKMYNGHRLESHLYCPEHLTRIKMGGPTCPEGDHVVAEPVKGYDWEDQVVLLEHDELAALPLDHDGVITLEACVPTEDIDPSIFEGAYIGFPTSDAALKSFAILSAFLRGEEARTFVGRGTWYGGTRAFVIRWDDHRNVMVVHTCNYLANMMVENVVTASGIRLPDVGELDVALAETVFGSMPSEFDWSSVVDTVDAKTRAIVAEKAETGQVTEVPKTVPITDIPDITEALKEMIGSR